MSVFLRSSFRLLIGVGSMGITQSRPPTVDGVMEMINQMCEDDRSEVMRLLLTSDGKESINRLSLWSIMTHRAITNLDRQEYLDRGVVCYSGICPCCRKPVCIDVNCRTREKDVTNPQKATDSRYAYVTVLYGSKPSYFLQALVCGWGLRSMNSCHDLVLVHTKDVPMAYLKCLQQVFTRLHVVEYITCCKRLLAGEQSTRFDLVFTKLRCLELDQLGYDKIVLVDSDTLSVSNMDDLFDLQAPAAMKRGAYQPVHGSMFRAESLYSKGWWGNATGINAGIMLLKPDSWELEQMIEEITDDTHPEHCYCNGPEQDYLSRYYSDWRHVSCRYNFQLHHLYFNCLDSPFYHNIEWNTVSKDDVKMFHYSTETKPSDWVLEKILASIDGRLPEDLDSFALTMRSRLPSYVGLCAVDPSVTLGMPPSGWSFPYGTYMSSDWVRTRYWYEWVCPSPTVSTCNSSTQEGASSASSDNEQRYSDEDGKSESPGWEMREMPEPVSQKALKRADDITVSAFNDWYKAYLNVREHLASCGLNLERILQDGLCGTLCAGCNNVLPSTKTGPFPVCVDTPHDDQYCIDCCESWETIHMWDEDHNANTSRVPCEQEDEEWAPWEIDTVAEFERVNRYRARPRCISPNEGWMVLGRHVRAGECPSEYLHVGTATWSSKAFRNNAC
ncbi:hypothetical protein FOL47_005970 [Perkinsus chesapeaki]|uniref:Glycogenin n=1 Tax=Perkinsus chesapeaki TaxID=330153 RepID=A0A7J6MYQ0_PERCH|nr:hypothetical protein FOL47_005970 [Perkinsus chesapeaki]